MSSTVKPFEILLKHSKYTFTSETSALELINADTIIIEKAAARILMHRYLFLSLLACTEKKILLTPKITTFLRNLPFGN